MTTPQRRGILPLSCDPVTFGHIHLCEKALERCDRLLVLVADNPKKNYTFGMADRVALLKRAIGSNPRVEVIGTPGLVPDVFLDQACDVLFRGNRSAAEMGYERGLIASYARVYPPIVNCIEFPDTLPAFAHISATAARECVMHHLDVGDLAPTFVQQALQEQIHGQFKIAVTGEIASGKTYVAKTLVGRLMAARIPAHFVELDSLTRELYARQTPGGQRVREALATRFGDQVLTVGRKDVDRGALKEILFSDVNADGLAIDFIQKLTMPYVEMMYRAALNGKKGLVVLEWAQLAEMGLTRWANNNVVVVESGDRSVNAQQRSITPEQLTRIGRTQWSADRKCEYLRELIDRERSGSWMRLVNPREPSQFASSMDQLVNHVRELFPKLGLQKTI